MDIDPKHLTDICAMHGLTEKQTLFVVALIGNGRNATAAYRRAYDVRPTTKSNAVTVGAHKLLRDKKIRAVLEEIDATVKPAIIQRAIDVSGMNRAWVMQRLGEIAERGMRGLPVLGREGNQVLVLTQVGKLGALYSSDLTAALRGLELIGRALGMFNDRKAIEMQEVSPEVKKRWEEARERMFQVLGEFEKGNFLHLLDDGQPTEPPANSEKCPPNKNGTTGPEDVSPPPPKDWGG